MPGMPDSFCLSQVLIVNFIAIGSYPGHHRFGVFSQKIFELCSRNYSIHIALKPYFRRKKLTMC